MPTVSSHQPGSFCWIELATPDAGAAGDFYRGLFDWSVRESADEAGPYYVFQHRGRDAAAMYQRSDGKPHASWLSYIRVRSVDETAAAVASLGGTVIAGPMAVRDFGRVAVAGDPQGARFALWEPVRHHGVAVRDEPGTLCWNELLTPEPRAANAFYASLFGWRMKEAADNYTEWCLGQNAVAGMLRSSAAAASWMPYFSVHDCDAMVEAVQLKRGAVRTRAREIPSIGRFAVLSDPHGAQFAVICLAA